MRRTMILAAGLAVLAAVSAPSADAGPRTDGARPPGGSSGSSGGTINAGVTAPGGGGGGPGGGEYEVGQGDPCPEGGGTANFRAPTADELAGAGQPPAGFFWIHMSCGGGRLVPSHDIGIDTAALVDRARRQLPQIDVALSPEGRQLVNLETWLWVDESTWREVSAEASAGGYFVRITATPDRTEWDMGEGRGGPTCRENTPYDTGRSASAQESGCTYTYERPSAREEGRAYYATVTMVWTLAVESNLPVTTEPEAEREESFHVRVDEAQALNQDGR